MGHTIRVDAKVRDCCGTAVAVKCPKIPTTWSASLPVFIGKAYGLGLGLFGGFYGSGGRLHVFLCRISKGLTRRFKFVPAVRCSCCRGLKLNLAATRAARVRCHFRFDWGAEVGVCCGIVCFSQVGIAILVVRNVEAVVDFHNLIGVSCLNLAIAVALAVTVTVRYVDDQGKPLLGN